jgi:hypothetical protein
MKLLNLRTCLSSWMSDSVEERSCFPLSNSSYVFLFCLIYPLVYLFVCGRLHYLSDKGPWWLSLRWPWRDIFSVKVFLVSLAKINFNNYHLSLLNICILIPLTLFQHICIISKLISRKVLWMRPYLWSKSCVIVCGFCGRLNKVGLFTCLHRRDTESLVSLTLDRSCK